MNILKLAASKNKYITNNYDIIKHPFNVLNTFISMIQCFSGKFKFPPKNPKFPYWNSTTITACFRKHLFILCGILLKLVHHLLRHLSEYNFSFYTSYTSFIEIVLPSCKHMFEISGILFRLWWMLDTSKQEKEARNQDECFTEISHLPDRGILLFLINYARLSQFSNLGNTESWA